jgi:hypothetical protein
MDHAVEGSVLSQKGQYVFSQTCHRACQKRFFGVGWVAGKYHSMQQAVATPHALHAKTVLGLFELQGQDQNGDSMAHRLEYQSLTAVAYHEAGTLDHSLEGQEFEHGKSIRHHRQFDCHGPAAQGKNDRIPHGPYQLNDMVEHSWRYEPGAECDIGNRAIQRVKSGAIGFRLWPCRPAHRADMMIAGTSWERLKLGKIPEKSETADQELPNVINRVEPQRFNRRLRAAGATVSEEPQRLCLLVGPRLGRCETSTSGHAGVMDPQISES